MSRRAVILVTLSLALGVYYGRFAVPWLLELLPPQQAVDDWNPEFEQQQAARCAREEQAQQAEARQAELKRLIAKIERRKQWATVKRLEYLRRLPEDSVFDDD